MSYLYCFIHFANDFELLFYRFVTHVFESDGGLRLRGLLSVLRLGLEQALALSHQLITLKLLLLVYFSYFRLNRLSTVFRMNLEVSFVFDVELALLVLGGELSLPLLLVPDLLQARRFYHVQAVLEVSLNVCYCLFELLVEVVARDEEHLYYGRFNLH